MRATRRTDEAAGSGRAAVTNLECTDGVAIYALDAAVIVPARNCANTVGRQLAALAAQDFAGTWELLVVDNGSTDTTGSVARAWSERFPVSMTVLDCPRPGVNRARNAGARVARGKVLAFCDGDDEAASGWLTAIVAATHSADLVGGRLDETSLNSTHRRALRPHFVQGQLPVALGHLDFAPGANLAIGKTSLALLGGFDEAFTLGHDDVDLSFRAHQAGLRLGWAGDAVVAYRHREGGWRLFCQFVRYGRAEPLLYRHHRSCGLPRTKVLHALRRWTSLLPRLPRALINEEARGAWLVTAGSSLGRCFGSIEHRSLYL